MDLYLLEKDPVKKEYYKNLGIGAREYFNEDRPKPTLSFTPPYRMYLNQTTVGDRLKIEAFNQRFTGTEKQSEEWDRLAEEIEKQKEEE